MPRWPSPFLSAQRKGLSFVELTLVIGIIAVLSGIVILSVNPQKQMIMARDATRKSGAKTIHSAITQGIINSITFTVPSGVGSARAICKQGVTNITSCLNIDSLVPTIIASIPRDSTEPCPNFTGFKIYKTTDFVNVLPVQFGRSASNAYMDPTCYDTGGPPEIGVSVSVDGGASTTLTDGGDFYPGVLAVGTHQLVFTIQNTGTGPLSLPSTPSLSGSPTFSMGAFTTGALGANATRQFTVTFNPGTPADYTANLSITNDDSNENPFNFSITSPVTPVMPSGLIAWFDANRPNSVLDDKGAAVSNGGLVGEWQDYLNNATVLQKNGDSFMPTYIQDAMPSGKAGISFDGKEDMLSTPDKANLFSESDNDFTIFVAASFADSQNPYANLMDNAHNETDQNFAVQQMGESGNKNWFYLMYQGNGWNFIGPQPEAVSGPVVFTYQKDGKSIILNQNGNTVFDDNGDPNLRSQGAGFAIGAATNADQFFTGSISEILIFNTPLSAAQTDDIEQYLLHKYGL